MVSVPVCVSSVFCRFLLLTGVHQDSVPTGVSSVSDDRVAGQCWWLCPLALCPGLSRMGALGRESPALETGHQVFLWSPFSGLVKVYS